MLMGKSFSKYSTSPNSSLNIVPREKKIKSLKDKLQAGFKNKKFLVAEQKLLKFYIPKY